MAIPTSSINEGSANTAALAEYFQRTYNLVGQDAEYGKGRPTLAALPRDTERLKKGDVFHETLKVAGGYSGSTDWVTGNKYHAVSKTVRWTVGDPFRTVARIPFDVLALNRNPLGTLIDLKAGEVGDVRDGLLNGVEYELWNDGSGSLGQISAVSGTATITVTMTDPEQLINVDMGMHLTSNTLKDGSGTAHTNIYKVTDLDPMQGKFTATRVVDNTSAMVANDFIHVAGSVNNRMPGIPTFIPSAAPADTLYGVTRTGNPALSGWRFPFKASIAETIQFAFSKMGKWTNYEAGRTVVVLSTSDWLSLSIERESRVMEDPGAMQKWGVAGLIVRTAKGPITVISNVMLPDGRGYVIDFSTWKLYTLKNIPHVIDDDGQTWVRGGIDASDGYKNGDILSLQMRMWKVLLCLKPMSNGTFPTL